MDNTEKDHVYKALNNLVEVPFKDFKWRLESVDYNGKENIPRASLEKAKQLEVVKLLNQYYGRDALRVCIIVLQKCNINNVAKELENVLQKVPGVDAHQPIDYRNYIKKKFEKMKYPNAVPGEYVPLNKRYSKLIIIDYHRSEDERKHEITSTGRKHVEIIRKRAKSSISIETLFNPDKYGFIPQIVVLQGAAGIGKTMMAKKIMFDWASQQLYQDKFNYVFYISCKEMNLHAEKEKSSIEEIISKQWPMCHTVKNILKNEEKILFIIDGFDELRYSFDLSENYFCTKTWQEEPVGIILRSLFQKKLLPESCLIITTRPTALEKLHRCLEYPRNFEILGFSTKERQEYFYNFFENKDQAKKAFTFVEQNDTLFTMCVIPLVSWIICTVIKQETERSKDLPTTPCTLTEIYMLYLSSLLKFHHKEYDWKSKQDFQSYVKKLCSLAAEGIWNKKTLFLEKEVKEHSLDQGDSLPLFLNQDVFKRDIDCIENYSFIHSSFQEFFAALFYVLEEGEEQCSQNQNKKLQALLERYKSFRPNFAVGFHFLFGFLNEGKRMSRLKQEFGWEISPKNKEFLLNFVKSNLKKSWHNLQFQKEMFNYLYETQDDNFVKNAVHGITEIRYQCNSDMDLMIITYGLHHCQNLKHLHVIVPKFIYHSETELFVPENQEWNLDERYMEDFLKVLTKLKNLRRLCLVGWSFKVSCIKHLPEVFRKNETLKSLQLSLNDTDDTAAELLCKGLQDKDCNIETIMFTGETMTEFCSRNIAEVLRKNQKLRGLHLWLYYPDDKVAEILCGELQHENCRIEKLGLAREFLTKFSSRHFAEVLRKNQRLKELELVLKKIDDETEKLLYELLKCVNYVLDMLPLAEKFLIEIGNRDPAEAQRRNKRLRESMWHVKNTCDKTIELLLEMFNYPECTLEALWYYLNCLAKPCKTQFAEIFRKNQELLLKNPDDKTLQLLLVSLKDLECKIQMIELTGLYPVFTESRSRHFAKLLRENQTLRELESLLNNTVANIMEMLFQAYKDLQCTKESLRFLEQFLNEFCSNLPAPVGENQGLRDFESFLKNTVAQSIEVFKHPESTKEEIRHFGHFLNEFCNSLFALFSKYLGFSEIESFLMNTNDQTMELLCEGLKDAKCNIETLRILGEIPTKSCSRHLAEVLRKNQRLRVLDLCLKNQDDTTMELLYDGLKHPECTVETLWLDRDILTEFCKRHLTEVFRKNKKLRMLKLFLKNPDDKTLKLMCDGLKDPECKIETLRLDGEIMYESCSRQLEVIIQKKQRMSMLCLSLKNPDGKTMEVLCDGLKHSECIIDRLELAGVILTESYSRHLAEVLWKNQRLRTLKLSVNPDDKTMELLCDSLKHPECKIETLEFSREIPTESCSRHLEEVSRTNQRLSVVLFHKKPDDKTMEVLCVGLKHSECTLVKTWVDGEILTEFLTLQRRYLADIIRKMQRLTEQKLSLKNLDEKSVKVLFHMLKEPECKIKDLNLDVVILNESGSRHLVDDLTENYRLRVLYLSLENPDDKAMEVLCDGLKHPKCTIEILQLAELFLKESCRKHLAEVLRKTKRLSVLHLYLENADDKTVEVLCEGLKHPKCTIKMLQLDGEFLTESCSRYLGDVFMKNQRLKKVELSVKNPNDKIMKPLYEGLKDPQCKIETLQLVGEILTESCKRHLADVFRKNQKMRELKLSLINPDDKTLELMCDGLKDPECKIETLRLDGEVLGKSCSRQLEVVVRKKQRMSVLCLFLKNPDEKTMKVLCDGLTHSECTIETLELAGEILTDSCNRHLAEVFWKNQRLRKLKVSLKNPDDKTMELLCDSLKHPECKIETLLFVGEILTESCSRHLAEVLKTNQRLLCLSLKNPDDKIMEVLCDELKHSECTLEKLHLDREILTESCSRHLAELYRKNQKLRELKLSLQNPDEKTMEMLCDELKYPECKIETLQLDGEILNESNRRELTVVVRKKQRMSVLCLSLENPDDKTMEVLCEGLKHPDCTIETLQLAGHILTEPCTRHLAKVLRKKQSLSVLFLSLKNPEVKTIEMLCDALKHSECTIEMLQVVGEVLTESSSRHLAEVFRKNQKLRVLYWSLKNQDDKSMEVLCEGLKHPECTIEMLQLDGGILTESCSRHFAEVLTENHRLSVFYLSLKNPDDKAMEALCEGLKHPKCTIEILQLAQVILSESCRKHLAEVLRKNHRLRMLHLYFENTDDKTVEVLCEGLKHPECTIEKLQLIGEILTNSSSRNLALLFKKNKRLRELKLSLKNPDEKTMEILCEGLKYPECKIEAILFTGENLTESCSWHLAEVLRKNQRLRILYLSLQNPDDRTMELLFDGIKHPACTIETLQLDGAFLTDFCSRDLAEVFRKNQGLRKLELSIKNPDDKTIKQLCEGLKDPQCKIETLQFNGKYIMQNGKWMDANHTARFFIVNFFCFFMFACLIYFYFFSFF